MYATEDSTQALINDLVGASHGDFAKVKEIIEAHPELVNANAVWVETPIEAAAQMGRTDIIEYLLSKGAPLDICTAVVLGKKDEVEQRLAADPSLKDAKGAHGIDIMWYPAITGNLELARLLYDAGSEINVGNGGSPPIVGAAIRGHADMVRWLLDHGADTSLTNYEGKTAAEAARAAGHDDIAQLIESR